jgi:hypothetical protein
LGFFNIRFTTISSTRNSYQPVAHATDRRKHKTVYIPRMPIIMGWSVTFHFISLLTSRFIIALLSLLYYTSRPSHDGLGSF